MKIYCYAHTHWDFEWYFTNSESTIQLIYHMDEVFYALENNILQHYHLDGQLSIVEDYLHYVPQHKERFTNLVKKGKIIIGPWYTQSDELVISGESIIRNLYYGIKTAEQFGNWMKVGYLPDSFGQSKDMPKIFKGFGIDYFLFWRGLSADKCPHREFYWQSKDGSLVLSYNIKNGYFYGINTIFNDDVKTVEDTFLHGCSTKIALHPIGADQRYVDFNFQERLNYYTKNSTKNATYVEKTCEEFFDDLSKEPNLMTIEGELLDPSNSKIHRSIYSSRYDHKYYNDKIERRIIYQLEPLMTLGAHLGLEAKTTLLEKIWKKLLYNHAHDSACGCNSDKTNQSILARYQEVDELSYSACDYILRKLSISFADTKNNDLYIFNTLAEDRNQLIKVFISTQQQEFQIYDTQDKLVPFQILETKKEYRGSIKKDISLYDKKLFYYTHRILIHHSLLSLGISKLKIVEEPSKVPLLTPVNTPMISDAYYKIEIVKGQINITDLTQQRTYVNALSIEDSGDDGDTYDYSPPVPDKIYELNFTSAKIQTNTGKLFQKISLVGEFSLPTCLEERQNKTPQLINVPYVFDISLSNEGLIHTKMTIDNKALDHRMRVVFNTEIQSDISLADTICGTIERLNLPEHLDDWREIGWREEPSPIYPVIHFIGLSNKTNSSFALLKGIKEYEILNNSKIALTLFRSVAFLGKPELVRRPGIASGKEFQYVPTPKSQLTKKMVFKNAFYLGEKKELSQIKKMWSTYAVNPLYYQMQQLNVNGNTLEYFVSHPLRTQKEPISSLFNTNSISVEITSIMPLETDSYCLRFLNNTWEECKGGELRSSFIKKYQWVNLKGDPISKLITYKDSIELGSFKAEQLKTLKCHF